MAEISARAVKELRDRTGAGMMDCKRALSEAEGDVKKAVEVLRERGLAKAGKREGRTTSEGVIAISLDGGCGGMVEVGCETDFVARTDQFTQLAESLAAAVASDASIGSADALLEASVGGKNVAETITAAISTLGENVGAKRVVHFATDGIVGGYVHAGGKLGVLVSLEGADASQAGLAKDIAMHVAAADPSPLAIDRDGISKELLDSEGNIYRNQAVAEGKPEKVIDRIVEGKLAKFASSVCLVEQPFVRDPDKTVGDLLKEAGDKLKIASFERYKLGEVAE